jgi:hypothetical protein
MRKWFSTAAILAALVCAEPMLAGNPASVYSDFAADGVLSCRHSRADLIATLNDASLHQYADQLTFARLKLAIRKQLAGGCRRRARRSGLTRSGKKAATPEPRASESKPSGSEAEAGKARGKRVSGKPKKGAATDRKGVSRKPKQEPATTPTAGSGQRSALAPEDAATTNGKRHHGGLVLLGVLLLLVTLGSGGWAARRAFGPR